LAQLQLKDPTRSNVKEHPMQNRHWTPLLVVMATLASTAVIGVPLATAATSAPSLELANYPDDAPGTMSIDTIAKSTACQDKGYLRYSTRAHHCTNT
jgi:hypothetical protein